MGASLAPNQRLKIVEYLAVLVILLSWSKAEESSWYQGCYNLTEPNIVNTDESGPENPDSNFPPVVHCCAKCDALGKQYAGFSQQLGCACLDSLPEAEFVDAQLCNTSCPADLPRDGEEEEEDGGTQETEPTTPAAPLPCGSPDYYSVYNSRGPYLRTISLQVQASVHLDHPVAASLEFHFSAGSHVSLGVSGDPILNDARHVSVHWRTSANHTRKGTVQAAPDSLTGDTAWIVTFRTTGLHTLEVKVFNSISSWIAHATVNVIEPPPTTLELSMQPNEEHPTCIPKDIPKPEKKYVTVFQNQSVMFDASANHGKNLTFQWTFSDAPDDVITSSPEGCEDPNCLSTNQSHTFATIGQHLVTVKLDGLEIQQLQSQLAVIVLDHSIQSVGIQLLEESQALSPSHAAITFLVTIVTAARTRRSLLQLNFGDGTNRTYIIGPGPSSLGDQASAGTQPDHIELMASYGEECTLQSKLHHTYEPEGSFKVKLRAFNDWSEQQAELEQAIVIQKKLSRPYINHKAVLAVDIEANFNVTLFSQSSTMYCHWALWQLVTDGRTSLDNLTSSQLQLKYTFTEPGQYSVQLRVSNNVSDVRAESSFRVERPVSGLALHNLQDDYIEVGESSSFRAEVSAGSQVNFEWDFSDPNSNQQSIGYQDHESVANHTFLVPGTYNVSVTAGNNYNRQTESLSSPIHVQEAVSNLVLLFDSPTMLGNVTNVIAVATTGSPLKFLVEIDGSDQTDQIQKGPTEPDRNELTNNNQELKMVGRNLTLKKTFSDPGLHNVSVTAYNEVSDYMETVFLEVLGEVPMLSVVLLYPAVVGEHALFVAQLNDQMDTSRTDVVYTWMVNDTLIGHTAVPVINHVFDSPGNFSLECLAHNQVHESKVLIMVEVSDISNEPRFDQSAVNNIGRIDLTLNGLPPDVKEVKIDYGDTSPSHTINPSEHWHVWNHDYDSTGVYKVCARFVLDSGYEVTSGCSVSTVITVQQPIARLHLKGPTAVTVQSVSSQFTWIADSQSGSHMTYTWSIDGNEQPPTTRKQLFTNKFTTPGSYDISVEASNGHGSLVAETTVTALFPITELSISISPVIIESPSTLEIVIQGSKEIVLLVDFGDNSQQTTVSTENNTHHLQTLHSTNGIPRYKCQLQHQYQSVGTYRVSVGAHNAVSIRDTFKEALVEEAISGLVMTSNSPGILKPGQTVEVTVTVATGNNLTFKWSFFETRHNTEVVRHATSSTARHLFTTTGTFVPQVYVKNPWYEEAVSAELSYGFTVVEPIEGLSLIFFIRDQTSEYAAEWKKKKKSTDRISFFAKVTSGSDVKFLFVFGDDTKQQPQEGATDDNGGIDCLASHVYTERGEYQVSVIASNALSNVTVELPSKFYVQSAPDEVSFYKRNYYTLFGSDTTLRVSIGEGTDISYDLDMGDGSDLKEGSIVQYRYKDPGKYRVTVSARNKVGIAEAVADVYVQDIIQSVTLEVSEPVHSPKTNVTFTATPHPNHPHIAFPFYWIVSGKDSIYGLTNTWKTSFKDAGEYSVRVIAYNPHSKNVSSDPIMVNVVVPISQVGHLLLESGDPVPGHELLFSVNAYFGTDIWYCWDFDDGTSTNKTRNYQKKHTFDRTGQFDVVVRLFNLMTSVTRTMKIFITPQPCHSPVIDFLDLPKDGTKEIPRSREVKLEADIWINCSMTGSTTYTWKIYNSSNGQVLKDRSLRDPVLFLQPRDLHYGNYTVELTIEMTSGGVNVFHNSSGNFSVIASDLLAVIAGGIMRYGSRDENITLDASLSDDPDTRTAGVKDDLSFKWNCYDMSQPELPCFDNDMSDYMGNATRLLQIPGSAFKQTSTTFVFVLTVSQGGRKANTTQALEMEDKPKLNVNIECEDCKDGRINSDQKLVVQASHPGYSSGQLVYEWQLEQVLDGQLLTPSDAHSKGCVKADGSTYHNLMLGNITDDDDDSNNSTKSSTPVGPSVPGPAVTETTRPPTSTSSAPSTTTTPDGLFGGLNPDEGNSGGGRPASGPGIPGLGEGGGGGGGGGGGDTGGGGSPVAGMFGLEEEPSGARDFPESSPRGGGGIPGISEGGEGGSRPGIPEGPVTEDSREDEEEKEESGETGDSATGDKDEERREEHILRRPRIFLALREADTTAGLGRKVLALKKGVLQQGRTYIITVKVTHSENPSLTGTALAYFKVNESPVLGDCSVGPVTQEAVEMETEFQVYCREWKDSEKDEPIRYEVSYSMSEDQTPSLIYQGLNHEVKFKLPANRDAEGKVHPVDVNIAILDNRGSRTQVCSIPLTINPKNDSEDEASLFRLAGSYNDTLQKYIERGDNRNARLYIQMVTNRLNHLQNTDPVTRHRIRCSLLKTLMNMPMRDELEIQQTMTAVTSGTEVEEELDGECLDYAAELLERAGGHLQSLYSLTSTNPQVVLKLASTAIQGTSNVLTATLDNKLHMNNSQAKKVVTRTTKTVQLLLQAEMSQSVIGEEAVDRNTKSMYIYAKQYDTSANVQLLSPPPPDSDDTTPKAKFVFPANIGEKPSVQREEEDNDRDGDRQPTAGRGSGSSSSSDVTTPEEKDDGCVQAHLVCYDGNPYQYGEGKQRQIRTQVASLNLYGCGREDNQSLVVENLKGSPVLVELRHYPLEKNHELQELRKHQMNIYNFTLEAENLQMALHVEFNLRHVIKGRLFPISVLLRAGSRPDPVNYDRKWDFDKNQNKLTIFLKPGELRGEEGTIYYLGLVDRFYNAGKPREGEVTERKYELNLWWSQCLYWKEEEDSWSPDGCEIMPGSTYKKAECRCNHLSSFAGHFSLVPNDLDAADLEGFFHLDENPVAFSVIATIISLYLVLLTICVKLDYNDRHKGKVIQLIDNSPKDKQSYIVILETGFRKGAGTSAKVSLVLHGEDGMSETKELVSQSDTVTLDRNSREVFLMTVPQNLGNLFKVQIWHDNAGDNPSWFLSRVTVKDLATGKTYYFTCEKWFAVEEGDGKVEREITIQEGGLGFFMVLWSKGTQYFADYHLWFSPVTRPSYSRFTRAQRLTCCLNLLMSCMAVSAVWYDATENEYRGEFHLLDVSYRALIVGTITSMMVLPANMLIVFLFRRTKVRRAWVGDPPEKVRRPRSDSVFSVVSTDDILHQPLVTQSIFDQSILNWPSLQEWAQKMWAKQYQHNAVTGSTHSVQQVFTTDTLLTTIDPQDVNFEPEEPPPLPNPTVVLDQPLPTSKGTKENKKSPKALEAAKLARKAELDKAAEQREYEKRLLRELSSTKSNRIFLPQFFRFLAWFLSAVIIGGCGFVTVLYGLSFGKKKSILWLQSLFFSFVQCVFITHPILVLVLTFYTSIRYKDDMAVFDHHTDGMLLSRKKKKKKKPSEDNPEANLTKTEEKEYDLAEGIAARRRSRYLRFARPPLEKELIRSRNKTIKEKKACSLINETSVLMFQLALLIFMAFGKDLNASFYLNQSFKTTFVTTGNPQPFEQLQTMEEWWTWMETDFFDKVYWDKWYNGQPTAFDKAFIQNCMLIGQVNVRLVSEPPVSCDLPDRYKLPLCHHNYRKSLADSGGVNFTDDLVLLDRDRNVAYKQLTSLESRGWLDQPVDSVVTYFTLFHAASNLFVSVSLRLRQLAQGGMETSHSIDNSYLYKYTTLMDNFILACEMLYIVLTLLKLRYESMEFLRLKSDYIKNFWNCLQVAQCTLSLAFVGCYIYRYAIIYETVEELRGTYHEEYVDVAPIAFWDEILRSMVGVLLFLVILGALKLLRHRAPFTTFGNILKQATPSLLVFGLVFVVMVCTFASLGVALFGSLHEDFRSYDRGVTGIVGLLVGEYHPHGMESGSQGNILAWRLFVVCVLVFALGTLTAYIIAVLSFHYKVYKVKDNLIFSSRETLSYYWDRLLHFLGKRVVEAQPEDDNILPPEFTMAELEYQVESMLFKMNALTGSSNLPAKPIMDFTDSDTTYTYGEDVVSSASELPDFNDDRFESRIHKIEGNLFSHESHLTQLLQLDAIGLGADLLVKEKEKQLRNELELEIFRQLQLQRQDNHGVGPQSDTTYPSSLSDQLPSGESSSNYHGSVSASQSDSHGSGCQDSGGESPRGLRPPQLETKPKGPSKASRFAFPKAAHRTKTTQILLPAAEELEENVLGAKDAEHTSGTVTPEADPKQYSMDSSSALVLQDFNSQPSSSCLQDGIPMNHLQVKGQSSSESPSQEEVVPRSKSQLDKLKLGQGNNSVCSSSSGGAEVHSYLKNKDKLSTEKSLPADLNKVKTELAKVKSRTKDYDVLQEAHSSSDHDPGAKGKPPRSLRKTKSRGKGKGSRHFSPIVLDNLAFDNQAYSSDSDHEGEGHKRKQQIPGIGHKECWS